MASASFQGVYLNIIFKISMSILFVNIFFLLAFSQFNPKESTESLLWGKRFSLRVLPALTQSGRRSISKHPYRESRAAACQEHSGVDFENRLCCCWTDSTDLGERSTEDQKSLLDESFHQEKQFPNYWNPVLKLVLGQERSLEILSSFHLV